MAFGFFLAERMPKVGWAATLGEGLGLFVSPPVKWLHVVLSRLLIVMPELPSGLRRRSLSSYLSVIAYSVAVLVTAQALALWLDLELADLPPPEAALQQPASCGLSLLGRSVGAMIVALGFWVVLQRLLSSSVFLPVEGELLPDLCWLH